MTRSNTQRALMQPDEVLRLDNKQCIVLLRGQLPMMLYKITPQEFADYSKLRAVSIRDYPPDRPHCADGKASTQPAKVEDEADPASADVPPEPGDAPEPPAQDASSKPPEEERPVQSVSMRYPPNSSGLSGHWPNSPVQQANISDQEVEKAQDWLNQMKQQDHNKEELPYEKDHQ